MEIITPGREEKRIISEVGEYYNQVINSPARKRYEKMWFELNCFYEGMQWSDFLSSSNEYLFYSDINQGKIKTQINEVEPITNKHVARIVKKKPKVIGRPIAGKEHEDDIILKSNAFTGLMLSWEEKVNLHQHLTNAVLEAFVQGMSWINLYYDPNYGDTIYKDYPILDQFGNVIGVEERAVKQGEILPQVYNPFDVVISPTVESYDNIRRLQVKCFENPDEIYERYGQRVEPDNQIVDASLFSRKYRRLINKTMRETAERSMEDSVLKLIDYQLPSRKYPKGRYSVTAGGKILDYKEELPFGELMFVPFYCKQRKNKFFGDTFLRQLIAPQKQKNRILSLTLEILYNHGYPYWVSEKGNGILKKGIKGDSMQVLEYNTGSRPPTQQQPGQAPLYAFQLNSLVEEGMANISSQHDVTRGINPAGLNNAQALNALMDADDQVISLVEQGFFRSVEMLGNKYKKAASVVYTEDRVIDYSTDAGYLNSDTKMPVEWLKSLDDVRVVIEAVPDLPYSKPGKIQLVNDMISNGMLNMQVASEKRLARKIIDFTGVMDEFNEDEKSAMHENTQAKVGVQLAPPEEYEDHETHLYVHYKWMKSPEFKMMVKKNPMIKQIMMQHVAATKQMIPPPMPPDIPKKVNVNVKADATPAIGNQILEQAGLVQPSPPPPQMPGPGGPQGMMPPDMGGMQQFPMEQSQMPMPPMMG